MLLAGYVGGALAADVLREAHAKIEDGGKAMRLAVRSGTGFADQKFSCRNKHNNSGGISMAKLHVSALLSGILLANPASAAIVTYLVEGDVMYAPYGDGWGLDGSHMVWEMVFDTNALPTGIQYDVPGAPGGGVASAYDPLSTSLTFSNRPGGQPDLVLSPDASLSTINYNDMPGGYDNMTLGLVTGNPGYTYMFFSVDLGFLSSFFGPDGAAAPVPSAIAPGDVQGDIFYHDLDTEAGFYSLNNASLTVSAVPVPGAFWLLGSGLVAMLGLRRSKTTR